METIQFLSIEGEDYRQYNGKFNLDLGVSEDRHIVVPKSILCFEPRKEV